MKKLLFGLTFLGSMMMTGVSFEAKAAMGFKCKVEILPCYTSAGAGGLASSILGSKSRQICHENGNGLDCKCGQSTSC